MLCRTFLRLPLLPAQETVPTRLTGQLEQFLAYSGSAAIEIAGCPVARGTMRIIGFVWIYGASLQDPELFSPGRYPSIADFAPSTLGALRGVFAAALFWRRLRDGQHPDSA